MERPNALKFQDEVLHEIPDTANVSQDNISNKRRIFHDTVYMDRRQGEKVHQSLHDREKIHNLTVMTTTRDADQLFQAESRYTLDKTASCNNHTEANSAKRYGDNYSDSHVKSKISAKMDPHHPAANISQGFGKLNKRSVDQDTMAEWQQTSRKKVLFQLCDKNSVMSKSSCTSSEHKPQHGDGSLLLSVCSQDMILLPQNCESQTVLPSRAKGVHVEMMLASDTCSLVSQSCDIDSVILPPVDEDPVIKAAVKISPEMLPSVCPPPPLPPPPLPPLPASFSMCYPSSSPPIPPPPMPPPLPLPPPPPLPLPPPPPPPLPMSFPSSLPSLLPLSNASAVALPSTCKKSMAKPSVGSEMIHPVCHPFSHNLPLSSVPPFSSDMSAVMLPTTVKDYLAKPQAKITSEISQSVVSPSPPPLPPPPLPPHLLLSTGLIRDSVAVPHSKYQESLRNQRKMQPIQSKENTNTDKNFVQLCRLRSSISNHPSAQPTSLFSYKMSCQNSWKKAFLTRWQSSVESTIRVPEKFQVIRRQTFPSVKDHMPDKKETYQISGNGKPVDIANGKFIIVEQTKEIEGETFNKKDGDASKEVITQTPKKRKHVCINLESDNTKEIHQSVGRRPDPSIISETVKKRDKEDTKIWNSQRKLEALLSRTKTPLKEYQKGEIVKPLNPKNHKSIDIRLKASLLKGRLGMDKAKTSTDVQALSDQSANDTGVEKSSERKDSDTIANTVVKLRTKLADKLKSVQALKDAAYSDYDSAKTGNGNIVTVNDAETSTCQVPIKKRKLEKRSFIDSLCSVDILNSCDNVGSNEGEDRQSKDKVEKDENSIYCVLIKSEPSPNRLGEESVPSKTEKEKLICDREDNFSPIISSVYSLKGMMPTKTDPFLANEPSSESNQEQEIGDCFQQPCKNTMPVFELKKEEPEEPTEHLVFGIRED